jgi:hypothetical protein
METLDAPRWLLTAELVMAVITMLFGLWPSWRVFASVLADLRDSPRWQAMLLPSVVAVALIWRLSVEPTILYAPGEAAPHLSRIFSPLGDDADWHVHAGVGAYVPYFAAAVVAGKTLATIWALNAVLGSLSCVLVFALVRRLDTHRETALAAAAFAALHVPGMRVDASEQVVALANFVSLLAWISVIDAARAPRRSTLFAAAIALAVAIDVRPESILHALSALAFVVIARQRDWPRPSVRSLLVPAAITGLLTAPRLAIGAWAVTSSSADLPKPSLAVTLDVLMSWRHSFADPAVSSPLYSLLVLSGIATFVARRELRKAGYFTVWLVLAWLFYFNEWTLDRNDALRFQATTWPLLLALAGVGAGPLFALRSPAVRAGLAITGLLCLGAWIGVSRTLLFRPLPTDVELGFFLEHIDEIPKECTLLVHEARGPPGYYGPKFDPAWARELHGVKSRSFPPPPQPDEQGCRVLFSGVSCFSYHVHDVTDNEALMSAYRQPDHPPLYAFVDRAHRELSARHPPLPRPECAAISEHWELQPIFVTSVPETRGGSRIWTPPGSYAIGFYRLVAPRPRAGSSGSRD